MSEKLKEEPPMVPGGPQAEAPLLLSLQHQQPVHADPESPVQKEAQPLSGVQKAMQILAGVQVGLSVAALFIIALACAIVVETFGYNYMFCPYDGTRIWCHSGVWAIMAGGEIVVTARSRRRGGHLMVTYAILSLIVSVGMGILIITSSVWMSLSVPISQVIDGLGVFYSTAHFVCTMVSWWCLIWKKDREGYCSMADGDRMSGFTYTIRAVHITQPQETGYPQIVMNAEKSGGDHGDLSQVHHISGVQQKLG